jgi:hypothetical protein
MTVFPQPATLRSPVVSPGPIHLLFLAITTALTALVIVLAVMSFPIDTRATTPTTPTTQVGDAEPQVVDTRRGGGGQILFR